MVIGWFLHCVNAFRRFAAIWGTSKLGEGASGTAHAEVVIALLFSLAAKLPLVRQSIAPL
jgi:hypothetical protein